MQALGKAGDLVSDLVGDLVGDLVSDLVGNLVGFWYIFCNPGRLSCVVTWWSESHLGWCLGWSEAILGGVLHGGPRSYLFHRNLGQRNDGAEFFPLN